MRFLLFTLYAPMCSFGEIAVGERRMSWARPGRSAVLGLIAAAQGAERADQAVHEALERGLYYGVRTDAPGLAFTDYHTAQTPKARKGQEFTTRRDELAADTLNTVLSVREWRTDSCFTIALWPRPHGSIDLNGIATALSHPQFTLYAGRKSAPLGLPLNPEVIEAESFMSAFEKRDQNRNKEERDLLVHLLGTNGPGPVDIAFDHDAPNAPTSDVRIERRRDSVLNRNRWQFADRLEGVWNGPARPS